MHEFSLIHDLMRKIETIAREQKALRVAGVRVRFGALAHISADHFRGRFEQASKGTIADGATLSIETPTAENDPLAQDIMLESVDLE